MVSTSHSVAIVLVFFLVGCSSENFSEQSISYGTYSNGCLLKGRPISKESKNHVLLNPERDRNWGHPHLIDYLMALGAKVSRSMKGKIFIGDLSAAHGGPTISGHRSHQNGLDVDLSYNVRRPKNNVLFLDKDEIALLKLSLQDNRVERIFVHYHFKKQLCELKSSVLSEEEQKRVRPWWGHKDHFHVRLRCPRSQSECVSQKPTTDTGCGDSLSWWFSEEARTVNPRKKISPRADYKDRLKNLPRVCQKIVAVKKD